ncbi:hypothetical protein [Streptomyces longispororuber]|uniref:hypothetical protein n=1 Tax=Streptomyces longispororuber TaxID=68230 RepID=UPI00210966EC|nr:hypothetical protein [Streptomyces longispororuber]MCQ4208766.1 hypothetical protein [Streptomyces longispororuber]
MFSVEERDLVRARLLALAEADPGVDGAAVTGSFAVDGGDRWSDIDVMLGVRGDPAAALERWTELLYGEFGALHHWDLPAGSLVYRVFLLPGGLEVDLGFASGDDFAPRGPAWRTVFGVPGPGREPAPPGPGRLAGLGWHHALHARACVERGRGWQAQYWIGALRDQVIALACVRLGLPWAYAKGAHLLPVEVTGPLEETLARSLDAVELRRALRAAVRAFLAELARTDGELAKRLGTVLDRAGVEEQGQG